MLTTAQRSRTVCWCLILSVQQSMSTFQKLPKFSRIGIKPQWCKTVQWIWNSVITIKVHIIRVTHVLNGHSNSCFIYYYLGFIDTWAKNPYHFQGHRGVVSNLKSSRCAVIQRRKPFKVIFTPALQSCKASLYSFSLHVYIAWWDIMAHLY